MINETYPELTGFLVERHETLPPDFPDKCPVCGANYKNIIKVDEFNARAEYKCGGKYLRKPQIQNHTRIWWGSCPKAKKCNKIGLTIDVPDGILHDALIDAGISDEKENKNDITGRRFGKLTAIYEGANKEWAFRCDCGRELFLNTQDVKLGKIKSCGCSRKFSAVE